MLPSVIIVVVLLHNFGQRSTAVEGKDPIPEPRQARPKPEVVGIAEGLPDVLKSQIRVKLVFGTGTRLFETSSAEICRLIKMGIWELVCRQI